MKFVNAVSALLCASTAIAAPLTEQRRASRARRAAQRHSSTPMYVESDPHVFEAAATNVSYSQNWAGAVQIGTGFSSVTGTIVVPSTPAAGASGGGDGAAASAWVGIDGDTCQTAILQTGVDFTSNGDGYSYQAWYEWYPDYAENFNLDINAGDTIVMTVTATSTTAGSAVIENQTTGKSVSHKFSRETSGALCQTNAEWIVEDFEQGGSLVPFANFGTVTFTDATAKGSSGTIGVSGAGILDIRQNNVTLTSCNVSGSSELTCTYL